MTKIPQEKKINYRKIPNAKKQPFTYSIWKRLDLLVATPLERLIMLELYYTFSIYQWLLQEDKLLWDYKDMRNFVRDLTKKINKNNL